MHVKLLDLFTGTGSVARVNNKYKGRHHHRMQYWSFPLSPPPKLLLSQRAEQKAALRISTGTLTVAQHKQRIGAASVKVSSAPLPRGRSSSACTTHPAF